MIHYVFLLCYDTIKKYRNNIFNNTPTGRSRIQTWQEEDEMPKIGERYIFDLRKCESKPRWKGYIEEKSLEIKNERKCHHEVKIQTTSHIIQYPINLMIRLCQIILMYRGRSLKFVSQFLELSRKRSKAMAKHLVVKKEESKVSSIWLNSALKKMKENELYHARYLIELDHVKHLNFLGDKNNSLLLIAIQKCAQAVNELKQC